MQPYEHVHASWVKLVCNLKWLTGAISLRFLSMKNSNIALQPIASLLHINDFDVALEPRLQTMQLKFRAWLNRVIEEEIGLQTSMKPLAGTVCLFFPSLFFGKSFSPADVKPLLSMEQIPR